MEEVVKEKYYHKVNHSYRDKIIVPMIAVTNNYRFVITDEQRYIITADEVKCKVTHIEVRNIFDLESDIDKIPENFGSRLSNAFSRGWDNFLDNTEDLLVSIAYGWMGWLIFIVVAFAGVKIGLRVVRKWKVKKEGKISDAGQDRAE